MTGSSASLPATRVQFREGASNWVDTPFLQATTFEHEHERRTPNAERRMPNAAAPCEELVPTLSSGRAVSLGRCRAEIRNEVVETYSYTRPRAICGRPST